MLFYLYISVHDHTVRISPENPIIKDAMVNVKRIEVNLYDVLGNPYTYHYLVVSKAGTTQTTRRQIRFGNRSARGGYEKPVSEQLVAG